MGEIKYIAYGLHKLHPTQLIMLDKPTVSSDSFILEKMKKQHWPFERAHSLVLCVSQCQSPVSPLKHLKQPWDTSWVT